MELQFLNWEKYNKRRGGIKTPVWFAFNDKFFLDPIIMEMSNEEKLSLIFLLCEASQQNANGFLIVSETKFTRLTNIDTIHLESTISKLLKSKVAIARRTRRVHHTTRQDITRHNITEKSLPDGRESAFDFEILYQNYPRKIGKAKGIATLVKTIKSQSDYEALARAIENYAKDIKKKQTEEKYIKHFSTFIGSKENQAWRDYVDLEVEPKRKEKVISDFSELE